MVLTKTSAGHFSGSIGDKAKVLLKPSDASVELRVISAAYGDKVLTVSKNSVTVTLVSEENPLTLVYGATEERARVNLKEIDGTDEQQLRFSTFDPGWPSITIFITGE